MDTVVMVRLVAGVMVVFACILLYFLPSIIARRKRNARAIFWLNLLTGWTFIGWVGSLVWALTNDSALSTIPQGYPAAVPCGSCGRYSNAGSQFCSACGQPLALMRRSATVG
jgi:hypothetical protein